MKIDTNSLKIAWFGNGLRSQCDDKKNIIISNLVEYKFGVAVVL